jgi:hypothetical protein
VVERQLERPVLPLLRSELVVMTGSPRRLVEESPRAATEMATMARAKATATQQPTSVELTAQARETPQPACVQRPRLQATRLRPVTVDAQQPAHLHHPAAESLALSRQPQGAKDPAKAVAACVERQPVVGLPPTSSPIGLADQIERAAQSERAVQSEPAVRIEQAPRIQPCRAAQ